MEWNSRSISRLGIVLGTAGEYLLRFCGRRMRQPLSVPARARWLHECCGTGLRRLRIPVHASGNFPARGLVVSNHLSYLDILVYSSIAPCVFVSKHEVRSWPVFGLMGAIAGTVFINRARNADALRVNNEMLETLAQDAVVILFAEGTSTNGHEVLPFRPALFEGVVRTGTAITPAHIHYQLASGSVEDDVCYWGGHSFFPHLLRLLSRRGLEARIRFSAEARTFDDRKIAAQEMHQAVSQLARPLAAEEEVFGD